MGRAAANAALPQLDCARLEAAGARPAAPGYAARRRAHRAGVRERARRNATSPTGPALGRRGQLRAQPLIGLNPPHVPAQRLSRDPETRASCAIGRPLSITTRALRSRSSDGYFLGRSWRRSVLLPREQNPRINTSSSNPARLIGSLGRHPIAQRRRHQKHLVSVTTDEPRTHARLGVNGA
jgi:hypothetical protein